MRMGKSTAPFSTESGINPIVVVLGFLTFAFGLLGIARLLEGGAESLAFIKAS